MSVLEQKKSAESIRNIRQSQHSKRLTSPEKQSPGQLRGCAGRQDKHLTEKLPASQPIGQPTGSPPHPAVTTSLQSLAGSSMSLPPSASKSVALS